ncbi:MAG: hypothetical protein LC803_15830 [Acidobacteria bacterium]|nr:hypothetical protein [Acidobacteriota bacterium]
MGDEACEQVLQLAGGRMNYVYFPSNSMVSLISQLSDGSSVEIGINGYEGMYYNTGRKFPVRERT